MCAVPARLPAWEPVPEDDDEELLHASSRAAADGTANARAAPRRSIWRRLRNPASPFPEHSPGRTMRTAPRSEEHTSELQSRPHLVCRLLLEKKKKNDKQNFTHTKQKKSDKH